MTKDNVSNFTKYNFTTMFRMSFPSQNAADKNIIWDVVEITFQKRLKYQFMITNILSTI